MIEISEEQQEAYRTAMEFPAPSLIRFLTDCLQAMTATAMKAEWELLALLGPHDPTPRTWLWNDWLAAAEKRLRGKP